MSCTIAAYAKRAWLCSAENSIYMLKFITTGSTVMPSLATLHRRSSGDDFSCRGQHGPQSCDILSFRTAALLLRLRKIGGRHTFPIGFLCAVLSKREMLSLDFLHFTRIGNGFSLFRQTKSPRPQKQRLGAFGQWKSNTRFLGGFKRWISGENETSVSGGPAERAESESAARSEGYKDLRPDWPASTLPWKRHAAWQWIETCPPV